MSFMTQSCKGAAALVLGVSAFLAIGCGGSSSSSNLPSTFSGSINVRNADGIHQPSGSMSPLPSSVSFTDGELVVNNPDIFIVEGLEATLAALGVLTPQSSSSLQFPSSGTYYYNEQVRYEGEIEWDEESLTATWEQGTVRIGEVSIPALVKTIQGDSLWFDQKEIYTIANGWIWWLSEDDFFDDDGGWDDDDDDWDDDWEWDFSKPVNNNSNGSDLATVRQMVPFLPVNFAAGDAFHYNFKISLFGNLEGRVAWKVDAVDVATPNGAYTGAIRILHRQGSVAEFFGVRETFSAEGSSYYKSGIGLVYVSEVERSKEDGEDEEVEEFLIEMVASPTSLEVEF